MSHLLLPIAATVGKKCVVVADVTQEALDADNIAFSVSSVDLIDASPPAAPSTIDPNPIATNETSSPMNPPETPNKLEDDKQPRSNASKDVIGTINSDMEEDTSSTTEGKKRKNTVPAAKSAKKSATNEKKGAAKELFPSKSKPQPHQ